MAFATIIETDATYICFLLFAGYTLPLYSTVEPCESRPICEYGFDYQGIHNLNLP